MRASSIIFNKIILSTLLVVAVFSILTPINAISGVFFTSGFIYDLYFDSLKRVFLVLIACVLYASYSIFLYRTVLLSIFTIIFSLMGMLVLFYLGLLSLLFIGF